LTCQGVSPGKSNLRGVLGPVETATLAVNTNHHQINSPKHTKHSPSLFAYNVQRRLPRRLLPSHSESDE
jgi:tetratricopeptide (TPR) repeat protein